jgi:hypothetical protein
MYQLAFGGIAVAVFRVSVFEDVLGDLIFILHQVVSRISRDLTTQRTRSPETN